MTTLSLPLITTIRWITRFALKNMAGLTVWCWHWRNQRTPSPVGHLQVDQLGRVVGVLRDPQGVHFDPPRPLNEREIYQLLAHGAGNTGVSLVPAPDNGEIESLREEVALLGEEVEALRRSDTSNGKTASQLAAEGRVGQTLEEFFAAHDSASMSELARLLGVSKSTAHGWAHGLRF